MNAIARFLIKKQSSIGSAAFILMVTVALSRVLGLVRDRMLAGYFNPDELGIYFAAFRLPNMLFELLVMGALTTAFIPVFTKLLTKKSEQHAWKMASVVMNAGMILLGVITIPILLFAEPISRMLAPGFTPEQIQEMVFFTRIMMLFQVYPLMIGNFFTGMLQSYQIFFIPAVAPVLYNVGIIAGTIFLTHTIGLFAPIVGVIIGAWLFLLVQFLPIAAMKYKHNWSLDTKTDGVKEVGSLMLPRTLGVAVGQIDTTVDLAMASLLGSKMVTIFHFAQHLQHLPVGLFGATIAQAALPSLSRASAGEERKAFKEQLISAVHQILFFVLPVSVFFIVLRLPITRLVFGSDQFDWEATVLTGKTLSAFSLSLFAQAVIHVFARGFYALYDTKTPVFVGIVSILINAVLSIVFIYVLHLPVWALGISTTAASLFQAGVLFVLLQKKIGRFSLEDMVLAPFRISLAAGFMGIILFVLTKLLDQLVFDTTRTINLILLVGTVGTIGMSVYLFLSWVFGIGQIAAFVYFLNRLKKLRSKVVSWNIPLLYPQNSDTT